MAVQPEDGGSVSGGVAAHAFEDTGAVVESVRQHVHVCIVPVDELPVEPDFFGLCKTHRRINISSRPSIRPIRSRMSQFRVEKRRVEAELTLSGGQQLRGFFFLAGSTATHHGPELVVDLLNSGPGFFPFESAETSSTVLVNRDHVVS